MAMAQLPGPTAGLTTREREILGLMAAGLSNAAIAQASYLSPKTVEHHVARVFAKLGIHDTPLVNRRVQAVVIYLGAAASEKSAA